MYSRLALREGRELNTRQIEVDRRVVPRARTAQCYSHRTPLLSSATCSTIRCRADSLRTTHSSRLVVPDSGLVKRTASMLVIRVRLKNSWRTARDYLDGVGFAGAAAAVQCAAVNGSRPEQVDVGIRRRRCRRPACRRQFRPMSRSLPPPPFRKSPRLCPVRRSALAPNRKSCRVCQNQRTFRPAPQAAPRLAGHPDKTFRK